MAEARGLLHGVVKELHACQFLIREVDLFALFFCKFQKFGGEIGKVIGMILLDGAQIGSADLVHCCVWGQTKYIGAISGLTFRRRSI